MKLTSEMIVPAVFVLAIGGLIAVSCSQCVADCPETHPDEIVSVEIGTIVMDGEVCKIEEAQRVRYERGSWAVKADVRNNPQQYPYDSKRSCVIGKVDRCPLVRRVICPSGKNGQSTVGHDGTKFHRETIE